MAVRKRRAIEIAGSREGTLLAATLGGQIRAARIRRRLTVAALGARVGLSTSRMSAIERGEGTGVPLRTWVAIGIAVGRPLAVTLSRPLDAEAGVDGAIDAGHLAIQELLLAHTARFGRLATFELPTRPADPAHSVDVCIRDDRQRCLLVIEAWNDLRDLGAATRSFHRKLAEAEGLAAALAHGGTPYRVAGAWVVGATARNRALVARYPRVFESVLPGSSRAWVKALVSGEPAPLEPGFVWFDLGRERLVARRRRDPDALEPSVEGNQPRRAPRLAMAIPARQ